MEMLQLYFNKVTPGYFLRSETSMFYVTVRIGISVEAAEHLLKQTRWRMFESQTYKVWTIDGPKAISPS